jgi:hypothetical protein
MLTESTDLVREQAYLVARGVRSLAVIGGCDDTCEAIQEAETALSVTAQGKVISYVVPSGGQGMLYGYASHAWVVDLFRWALADCPEHHAHRVIGLLLGYNPDSIREFEELRSGVRWGPSDRTDLFRDTLSKGERYLP